MYAVIEIGGKQYLVQEKDVLRVEKVLTEESKLFTSDKVMFVSAGKGSKVGAPFVKGAQVELKVKKHGLSDKVIIFKMKAKKRYKRLRGHREPYSEVEVQKIVG